MKPLKVYVAGPISAHSNHTRPLLCSLENIRRGIRASNRILLSGHIPFCPFTDFLLWFQLWPGEEITETMIKNYSLEWLKVCDCIVMIDGWEKSSGAKAEMRLARKLNKQVFMGVEAFLGTFAPCY